MNRGDELTYQLTVLTDECNRVAAPYSVRTVLCDGGFAVWQKLRDVDDIPEILISPSLVEAHQRFIIYQKQNPNGKQTQ